MSLVQFLRWNPYFPLMISGLLLFRLQAHGPPPLLIKAGKLYDAENHRFLPHQQVLVKGNTIVKVGTRLRVPKGTRVLNVPKGTVTPGLMDMHTHLLLHKRQDQGMEVGSKLSDEQRLQQALAFARQHLLVGITTVRDLGNSGQYLDVCLRDSLQESTTPAPRLFVSGPIISPPGGQFNQLASSDSFLIDQEYQVIASAAEASMAVLQHAKRGVNVIKVCADTDTRTLSLEEMQAIVKTAHQLGIPVTAHATTDASARRAVLAGVDGLEHGYELSDSTLYLMAHQGTYLVPTDVSRRKAMNLVAGLGMTEEAGKAYANSFLATTQDRLRRALAKGVMIVSGSDYYYYSAKVELLSRGDGAKDVLVAYYEAGIPVADVLGFATRNAAKALGLHKSLGALKQGMKADLVIFEGDLETDFEKALYSVQWVVKDGALYDPKQQP